MYTIVLRPLPGAIVAEDDPADLEFVTACRVHHSDDFLFSLVAWFVEEVISLFFEVSATKNGLAELRLVLVQLVHDSITIPPITYTDQRRVRGLRDEDVV